MTSADISSGGRIPPDCDLLQPKLREIIRLSKSSASVSLSYWHSFDTARLTFTHFNLLSTFRLQHFLAQILHESGCLHIEEESLYYTHPERIKDVWPIRFRSIQDAEPYVRNPQKLANYVYNGRMGNREGTSDGYDFRGRGLLQITGRESYDRIGKILGLNLVDHPDLILDPKNALSVACAEWNYLGCNAAADEDDVVGVTRKVNGGVVGLDERRKMLAYVKMVIPVSPYL